MSNDRMPTLSWVQNYELAKKYYEYYGNLLIPQMFKTNDGINYDENGIKLGIWISDQRRRRKNPKKGRLSEYQKNCLDSIKMVWDLYEDEWLNNYELAKNYYNYYGNLNVISKFKTKNGVDYDEKGFSLGKWISIQRERYSQALLTTKQIKLLEDIEIEWKVENILWEQHYKLAKKYYEHYGNLKIPGDFTTNNGIDYHRDGFALGKWVLKQRQKYKGSYDRPITSNQIKLLESIGMTWFTDNLDKKAQVEIIDLVNVKRKNKEILNRTYSLLNNFENSSLPTKEELNKKYMEELNILDEKNVKEENAVVVNIKKSTLWMNNYKLAKAYLNYYGDLFIPYYFKTKDGVSYDEDGILLGKWLNSQRKKRNERHHRISKIQIYLLDMLGMEWKIQEARWEDCYKLLQTYFDYYGDLEIPKGFKTKDGINYDEDGYNLFNWFNRQKEKYRSVEGANLRSDQIDRLDDLGVVWDKNIEVWDKFYQLAKNYYKYYGNLLIPQDFKTINGIDYDKEGFALGKWISKQRQAYKANSPNKVNCYQIWLLEKIGMVWFDKRVDERLQKQIITELNVINKKREILSRVYSLLNTYDLKSLPSKEQINDDFVKRLTLEKNE